MQQIQYIQIAAEKYRVRKKRKPVYCCSAVWHTICSQRIYT